MRQSRALLLWFLAALLAPAIFLCPTRTRQANDYRVTERRIPLGVKGAEFLLRDLQYRRLAEEVTSGAATPEMKGLRLLDWTRSNIRPTPPGWTVRDDHISNIIIRGYGEKDQMADVFTTLAVYAGLPAFWKTIRTGPEKQGRILSFVRIRDRWTVWDAAGGTGPEELSAHPEVPSPLGVPGCLRAEKQMPARRVLFELARFREKMTSRGN